MINSNIPIYLFTLGITGIVALMLWKIFRLVFGDSPGGSDRGGQAALTI